MNRTEIENQLLQESRGLPLEKLQESLNFILFLKHRLNLHQEALVKQSFDLSEENDNFRLNDFVESKELLPKNAPGMNWRDAISEKAKLLVSVEELIKPMTDIWEDYI